MKTDKAYESARKGKEGVVGESHIWDGPLEQEGRAHGKGSSSGITGLEVSKFKTVYKAGPITQRAKG